MIKVVKALLGAALALAYVPAFATGIVPLSGSQQFDKDSSPPAFLNAGKLYVYQPGTTTCATVFSDFALTSALPCPIVLNAAGRIPPIYAADGSVRLRLLNSANLLQFDEDSVAIVTAAVTSGGTTPIPDATQIFGTRDLKVRFDDQPISGYVRMNGRTIGSATSGASERANVDTQSLFLALWGYANVSVVSGKGGTAAADWAANKLLVLPDLSGRLLGGLDDMGGGVRGRITGATVTGPTVVGAAGGIETNLINQINLPPLNLPSSLAWVQDTGTSNRSGITSAGGVSATTPGAVAVIPLTEVFTQTITVTGHLTGNVSTGGSGTALNGMPPVMLLTFYLKL